MALGPVLRYELIATSRRGRYYAARFAYGLLLLSSLMQQHALVTSYRRVYGYGQLATTSEETIRQMTLFAQVALRGFAWAQWVAVLIVMPALTAGVIADAHRRKTLRDLLSSGLSGWSIVVGKLAARLVHVGAFGLVGLPVVALIGLFGGLDPWVISFAYGGMASMAMALGGMSILASTLARRPREAIVLAYVLEGAWLFLPMMLRPVVPFLTWPFYLLEPLNELVIASNPLEVWSQWDMVNDMSLANSSMGVVAPWVLSSIDALHAAFLAMLALHAAFGLLCVALAVALLRPLRSGDDEVPWAGFSRWCRRRLGLAAPRREGWSRPGWMSEPARRPCGDDPMWWKERNATARRGLAWSASLPFVLFLGTLLGCALFEIAKPSLLSLVTLGHYPASEQNREELHQATRAFAPWLFGFWLLATAGAGAVALVSEREDDTWTSLTATLLIGPEVVRAKVLGSLWGTRRLALAVLAVIGVGVLGGAVHPLGGLAALLGMATFGGFAAALGVSVSLGARTSTRALVVTVLLLFGINAASPAICYVLDPHSSSPFACVTAMPLLEWGTLLSYDEARALWYGGPRPRRFVSTPENRGSFEIVAFLAGVAGFGLAALGLTAAAGRAYERVAGRAVRNGPRLRIRPPH